MNILSEQLLGSIILILLSIQGILVKVTTGSLFHQKLESSAIPWIANILNLSILLLFTLLIAILLIIETAPDAMAR